MTTEEEYESYKDGFLSDYAVGETYVESDIMAGFYEMKYNNSARKNKEIIKALNGLLLFFEIEGENSMDRFERVAEVFKKETGYLRPGKDSVETPPEIRHAAWDKWVVQKVRNAQGAVLLNI